MPLELRTHALQVSGTCAPGAQLSLVSKHITFMYRIDKIFVRFPAGCDGLVRLYLLMCLDPSSPTTGLPPGTSLLSTLSPNDYLLGDDHSVTIDINLPVRIKGTWLKAHIVNSDGFPHSPSAIFTIQEILEDI